MSAQGERPVVSSSSGSAAVAGAAADAGGLSSLLLDARLAELVHSIRALVRSNDELGAALKEHPGDRDFIIAIRENEDIIVKRREAAAELVVRLRASGIDTDLPQDILDMTVALKGRSSAETSGGATEEKATAAKEEDLPKETTSASADGGLYL